MSGERKIEGQPLHALPMPPYGAASQPPQPAGVRAALEQLTEAAQLVQAKGAVTGFQWTKLALAIGRAKASLSALESQQEEAVAWQVRPKGAVGVWSLRHEKPKDPAKILDIRPLYAHPTPVQEAGATNGQ